MYNLEGRNEIRFNNAGGKCLLENWVEERATQHLEMTDTNIDEVNSVVWFFVSSWSKNNN